MRRFVISALLALAVVVLSGCGDDPDPAATGRTASKGVDATGVTRLEVGSAFEVRVTIGREEAATITYDDGLADRLDVGVEGETLHLRLRQRTTTDRRTLRAEVTLRRLEEVRVDGASSVEVTGKLQDPGLRLLVAGASRVAADLALDRADATVSGASRLELTGTANALGADGSGASRLELAALSLQNLDIQLSGASRATVNVNRTITAQVSGASKLSYKGAPQFARRDTSGASSIEPVQ